MGSRRWRNFIEHHFDPHFIRSIFDISDIVSNLDSPRKKRYFAFLFGVIGLAAIVIYTWLPVFRESFENDGTTLRLTIAIVTLTVEPVLLIFVALIIYSCPAPKRAPIRDNKRIGVVIPCHKSQDEIIDTLQACTYHFDEKQIFIIDNDNSNDYQHQDRMQQQLISNGFPNVNYIYQAIGNKTLALYAGAVAAKDFDFVLLIDDDVKLPETMEFDLGLLNETCKTVCYPIHAVYPGDHRRFSWLIKWQALEYKLSDFNKYFQSRFSTVHFPHGAIMLWERGPLIRCLRIHDTVFYGEDVRMGLWLQDHGYEMRHEYQHIVDTEAPSSWLGVGPNFYAQRVRSWDIGEHFRFVDYARVLFTTRHRTIIGTIVLKWYQFYACFCIALDWVRWPVLGICLWFGWERLVRIFALLITLSTVCIIIWDKLHSVAYPERKTDMAVILTFQFFKVAEHVQRWISWAGAYLAYLPNYRMKPRVVDLEAKYNDGSKIADDPKCPVWLRSWDYQYGRYYRHYDPNNPTAVNKPQQPAHGKECLAANPFGTGNETFHVEKVLRAQVEELSEEEYMGRNRIITLLRNGHFPAPQVRYIFQNHPRIAQVKDNLGNFLIHTACLCQARYDLLEMIANASPSNPVNSDGQSALHLACQEGGDEHVLQLLVDRWPDSVSQRDKLGRFPLHCAAALSLEAVKFLVREHPRAVRNMDRNGNYPLHRACAFSASCEVVGYLIDQFPEAVGAKNHEGYLPLHLVCENPHNLELILKLIDKEPSAVDKQNRRHELPCHVALRSGCSLQTIEQLYYPPIAASFLLVKDINGNTPLHLACSSPTPSADVIIRLVNSCPTALTKKNKKGNLPIHLFCSMVGSTAFFGEIPETGISPQLSAGRLVEALDVLRMQHTASLSTKNNLGQTPLHCSCSVEEPYPEFISSLMDDCDGAVIHQRDAFGNTPLHTACMQPKTSTKVIRLLLPLRERASREMDESNDDGSSYAARGYSPDPSSTVVRRGARRDTDSNSLTDSLFPSLATYDEDWLWTTNGDTPLHLAIRHTLSSDVIAHIEAVLPETIQMKNQDKLTPQQLKDRVTQAQDRQQQSTEWAQ